METDFSDLKDQVSNLVSNLEHISSEAKTFQDTTESLDILADQMSKACTSLSDILKQADTLYQHVNEVSVQKTLDSFKKSAGSFAQKSDDLISEMKQSQKTIVEETRQAISLLRRKVVSWGVASIICIIAATVLMIILR